MGIENIGRSKCACFYVMSDGNGFLVLHGFKKKTQKTPKKEISLALARYQEYKLRVEV
jgi:phage-related protein